jgi:hypothetical protein
LCRALREAFPDYEEFKELLADIDKNLDDLVPPSVGLRIAVQRVVRTAKSQGWLAVLETAAVEVNPGNPALKAWHAEHCVERRSAVVASAAVGVPAWQQFDPVYFDLTTIRAAIFRAIMAPPEPVLAFGVRYYDFAFINKLRDIVMGHLEGETQCKDPLNLKPEYDKLSRKVARARSYGQDLNAAHVMCVVLVDAAPAGHIADFWQQVRSEFARSTHHFVMLFVGDEDTAFPGGVTELPPPRFDRADLSVWAVSTVMQIRWPVTLAAAWTDLLCAGADNGAELDVGMIYEAMDRSIREIRFDAEGFRRKLENRMGR